MNQNPNNFDIIRSVSKDKFYLLKQFNLIKDLTNQYFNTNNFLIKNNNEIKLISDLLYYALTTLLNRQTLGQECFNLIFYNSKNRSLQNTSARFLIIFFKTVLPYLINKLFYLTSLNRSFSYKYFIIILYFFKLLYFTLKKLNQIFFYFGDSKSQVYFNLENRLTQTKYISLNNNQTNLFLISIRLIGLLKSINLLINVITCIKDLKFINQSIILNNRDENDDRKEALKANQTERNVEKSLE